MKLKCTQEIMDNNSANGRIDLCMVKFVPTQYGVEQYIDNGTGYQLRAQIADQDWAEWVKTDRRARRAQEQDDGLEAGAIAQAANARKVPVSGVRRKQRTKARK